jgi:hypothetical protein
MSGPIMALSIVMLYEERIQSRAGMLTLLTLSTYASHSMQSVQVQIPLTTCMNGEDEKCTTFSSKSEKEISRFRNTRMDGNLPLEQASKK